MVKITLLDGKSFSLYGHSFLLMWSLFSICVILLLCQILLFKALGVFCHQCEKNNLIWYFSKLTQEDAIDNERDIIDELWTTSEKLWYYTSHKGRVEKKIHIVLTWLSIQIQIHVGSLHASI